MFQHNDNKLSISRRAASKISLLEDSAEILDLQCKVGVNQVDAEKQVKFAVSIQRATKYQPNMSRVRYYPRLACFKAVYNTLKLTCYANNAFRFAGIRYHTAYPPVTSMHTLNFVGKITKIRAHPTQFQVIIGWQP